MQKIIIGTNSFGYNQKRNFAALPFDDIEFKKVPDLYKVLDYLHFKLKGKNHPRFLNTFNDLDLNPVDAYHFFNTISEGRKPWLVTYEHALPRNNPHWKKGLSLLAGSSCLKIISFTHHAHRIQSNLIESHQDVKAEIKSKMMVLSPSQKRLVYSVKEKDFNPPFRFVFTGVDFFRKGGVEMLNSLERLHREGYPLVLELISKIKTGRWKDHHITESDIRSVKERVENSAWINHHYSLSNEEVMRIMQKSHIGLLPSYGETYGYSVLECQANGCPVITTNIPPFEEVNNNEIGWIVNVPLISREDVLTSDVYSEKGRQNFSEALTNGLYDVAKAIMDQPHVMQQKAEKCLEHISSNHDPSERVKILGDLYRSCVR